VLVNTFLAHIAVFQTIVGVCIYGFNVFATSAVLFKTLAVLVISHNSANLAHQAAHQDTILAISQTILKGFSSNCF
jgi:hypothetical protein